MKSFASLLFILIVSFSLLNDCQKDYLPVGDLDPGVALTFDDASLDNWLELLPLFQKYEAHATFFICTACTDNPLDKTKVIQLYDAGNEIGSHSQHHFHIKEYLNAHSLSDYYKFEIAPSLQFFDSLNIPVTSFAYPYGEHTTESDEYLSKYFQKIRGISSLRPSENNAFIIHKNKTVVYGAYIDRASPYQLEDFKKAILLTKEHRAVLVLIGHTPDSSSTYDWTFPVALLDSICNFTVQQKMKFYRMKDL
jgi:peptidoglycan/xylan/chitin deacetylase (PgdA/CDA1 family)